jgi:NSS family neurotransmitter:Na+ symporter
LRFSGFSLNLKTIFQEGNLTEAHPQEGAYMKETAGRENWGSRIGLILAMAGNAIGLGNFLRFPVKAAQNGGGAFMIPYFCALLLLGIPLMWVEWSMGRMGGRYGHGTTPGMFQRCWKHPIAKYLGAVGVALPLAFVIYYVCIESWTLGYSFFSATGKYFGILDEAGMKSFLFAYLGRPLAVGIAPQDAVHFSGLGTAFLFFVLTVLINTYILSKGIVKGIEVLAKIAMPALFIFAIILVVRVFTLGWSAPGTTGMVLGIEKGFGFIWNPDFSKLSSGAVWLAAAGQIFFTLSVGTGSIQTYASYLREKDDVALTGLTTSATNEFAEVILGGSIAIPIAVAFFGLGEAQEIAKGGAFDLGFTAMPIIFQKLPVGQVFGMLWFLLLFFAGITSSVALAQPAIAFLQDELKMARRPAAYIVGAAMLMFGGCVLYFVDHGFLDEMDFWAGTFGLVVFAFLEVVMFAWIYRMQNAWNEINTGADINVPRIFYYFIKYIAPVYLITLMIAWAIQDGIPVLLMQHAKPEDIPYLWAARVLMVGLNVVFFYLVHLAWKKKGVTT